jgi:hypothetical protein
VNAVSICACLLLTVGGLEAAQEGLLRNNGFEGPGVDFRLRPEARARIDGRIAEGWQDNSQWADLDLHYAIDPTGGRNGSAAQRVELRATADGSPQLLQEFEVQAGQTYTGRAWVRGLERVPVNLLLRASGSPYTLHARHQVLTTPDWQELRVTWTASADGRASFILNPEAAGTVWLDDAALSAALAEPRAAAPIPGTADPAQRGDGANLLRNPTLATPYGQIEARDGEISGAVAHGWEDNSAWADVTLRYEMDTLNARSGGACQRITVRSVRSGVVQFAQPFEMRRGRSYRAEVWVRAEVSMPVQVIVRDAKGPWQVHASSQATLAPSWQRMVLTWTAAKDFPVYLMVMPQGTGAMFLDEATVADVTGLPVPVNPAPPKTGNLLVNSSFEAGLANGWMLRLGQQPGNPIADDADFPTEAPVHGRHSVSFVAAGGLLRTGGSPADLATPKVAVNWGRPHVFSIWLRAERPVEVVQLRFGGGTERTVSIDREWHQYAVQATPGEGQDSMTGQVRILASEDTRIWADAAQIEEAEAASATYLEPHPIEIALTSDRAGAVHHGSDDVHLHVQLSPMAPEGSVLRARVYDLYGDQSVALPELRLPVESLEVPASVLRPLGVFRIVAEVVDSDGRALTAPTSTRFARLPRPIEIEPRESFFGIHTRFDAEGIAIARATGMRWLRVHDAAPHLTKWAVAEPDRDHFRFYDDLVDHALASGLAILGMFDGAPHWASAEPRASSGYFSMWNMPTGPDALERWENYVATLAAHYRGRIDHWEVWNEPWVDLFFPGGTPEFYADLMRRAHSRAKAANPDAYIVGISTADNHDAFTTAVLTAAGTDHYDALSFHAYIAGMANGPDNWALANATKYRALQAEHGEAKPVWLTEGGPGPHWQGFPAADSSPAGVWQNMSWIVRADVALKNAGIERFFVYSAAGREPAGAIGFQLLEHDRTIKPALAARAVLASTIDGAQALERSEPVPNAVESYAFLRRDGTTIRILWSMDNLEHRVAVQAGQVAFDMLGNPLPIHDGQIAVDGHPIYVGSSLP